MPTALCVGAFAAGLLVMVVFDVIMNGVFDGPWWVQFIGGAVEATVLVGIIWLSLGRVPLRPWVLRILSREK
ncbi:MAG: hypothetical protein ACRENX_11475 [Candidatus Dormibacteria bacterium]